MNAATTYAKIVATYVDQPVLVYNGDVFWNAKGLRYGKERPNVFSKPQYVQARGGDGDAR